MSCKSTFNLPLPAVLWSKPLLIITLLLALFPPGVFIADVAAQQRSVSALEEIVVTARKREENLQDVPIAITAVAGESIRSQGIAQLEWLAPTIPNFVVAEGTGADLVSVRGIGSGVNFGFEQAVGQVVDGFFYGRSRLTRMNFLDVEQVEILKGPQGALIGKNTTAGVINITTAKPTEEFEAWTSASYEAYEAGDGYILEGAVSGRVVDTLQARLAVRYQDSEGWVENPASNRDEPVNEDLTTRLSVRWQPTDDLMVDAQWTRGDYERNGQSKQLASCSQAMINFENFSTEVDLAGVTVNWNIGDFTLTSLTGYAQFESFDLSEGDRTPLEILNTRLGEDYEQLSQEIRLASPTGGTIDYLVGAYYQHREQETDFILDIATGGLPIGPPFSFSQNINTIEEGDTYAIFGQLNWSITEQWRVTLDGRFTHEEKEASQVFFPGSLYTSVPLGPPFTIILGTHNITQGRDEDDFSPGITLQWSPHDDSMYYGSVRRGFKGGGFDHQNQRPQAQVAQEFQFEEEQVIAYEIGSKMTLLDGSLQLNIALFRSEFEDLQVSIIDNSTGLAVARVGNAAEAISQGFEIDATWSPVSDLVLGGSLAYLNAEYDSFPDAPCYNLQSAATCTFTMGPTIDGVQDLKGRELENAPDWSAVFNAEYRWPLTSELNLIGFAQAVYSDAYAIASDLDPVTFQDDYWKLDARLTLTNVQNSWEISLIGRNLTDEITSTDNNDLPGFLPHAYHPFVDQTRSITLRGLIRF